MNSLEKRTGEIQIIMSLKNVTLEHYYSVKIDLYLIFRNSMFLLKQRIRQNLPMKILMISVMHYHNPS